jgi:hypothetical protein
MKCILVNGGGAGIGQGHGMPHVFVVPDDIKLPANPVLK